MPSNSRGVTSFVSAIILTAILVATAISVYLWGIPYVEKNKAVSETEYLQNKFVEIANAIEESTYKGKSCVDIITDAKIIVAENFILGTYFSPTSIYNNFFKIPLNVVYLPPELFNLSVGESIGDGPIKISYDGSEVCFYDNNTKINTCVAGGYVYTSAYYYSVSLASTYALVRRLDKVYYAEPVCVAFVSAVNSGAGQDINYQVECRPFIRNGNLQMIKILPWIDSVYQRGKRFCAQFYKVETISVNSTLNNSKMTVYYVYAYFE